MKLGIETAENWYSHIPKAVCEHEDITVLWNQGLQTSSSQQIDIIIKNKTDKTYLLTDIAISSDRNVMQRKSEKKLKYKNTKYRNSANVEHEVLRHTSSQWSHGRVIKRLQKYL
jgi:hypothetical protein